MLHESPPTVGESSALERGDVEPRERTVCGAYLLKLRIVLRGQTSERCHVDDQHHSTGELAERDLVLVDVKSVEVVQSGILGDLRSCRLGVHKAVELVGVFEGLVLVADVLEEALWNHTPHIAGVSHTSWGLWLRQ